MKRHVGKLIEGWVDGILGPEEEGRVQSHLDECGECRDLARTFREENQALGLLAQARREAPFSPDLLLSINHRLAFSPGPVAFSLATCFAGAAAFAVGLALAGLLIHEFAYRPIPAAPYAWRGLIQVEKSGVTRPVTAEYRPPVTRKDRFLISRESELILPLREAMLVAAKGPAAVTLTHLERNALTGRERVRVNLDYGALYVARGDRTAFEVTTRFGKISPAGTLFLVEVPEVGAGGLAKVVEGRVRVTGKAAGGRVTVNEGKVLQVESDENYRIRTLHPEEKAEILRAFGAWEKLPARRSIRREASKAKSAGPRLSEDDLLFYHYHLSN